MVTLPKIRHLATAVLGVCLLAPAMFAHAASAPEHAMCARDKAGALRILVLMPPSRWPAGGFRVTVNGKTVGRLDRDKRALAQLSRHEREALRYLPERARRAHVAGAAVIIYGRLLSDWRFARAAGMGGVFVHVPSHRGAVKIQGLNARGHFVGARLSCRLGSPKVPPAPARLRAKMSDNGTALYWKPLGRRSVPVLSFRILRHADSATEDLTRQAPFSPFDRNPTQPAYIDSLVPLEQDVTYNVRWVDALGRKGPWSSVRVYSMDLKALRPPARITVKVGTDSVSLHWPKSDNPHTAGYVVERAYLNTGPYEILTPKGIPAAKPAYRDTGLRGGTQYFYRVCAMGPRGDLGEPSDPVAAVARGRGAPPSPEHLTAQAGRTRVLLRWEPVAGNVAGYIIERRAEGSPRWSRLNQELHQPPRYDDLLGPQRGGLLQYRVSAVSEDNRVSRPSQVIKVRLVDSAPPLPPRIITADGTGGKVTLGLRAAVPVKDTAHIYILRGGSADDPGLVIGRALPGNARRFEDTWVQPGKVYWYHLVAYDASGNRSADGQAVEVRVGAPVLKRPAKPELHYVRAPMPMVTIRFKEPPEHVSVLVEASVDGGHWLTVAGPTSEAVAHDADPALGAVRYRIRYRAANGVLGPPSASAGLKRN